MFSSSLCTRCANQIRSSTALKGTPSELRGHLLPGAKSFHNSGPNRTRIRDKKLFIQSRKFLSSFPNRSSQEVKRGWKSKFLIGSVATACLGGAFYFSMTEKDRRKMRVFAGGIRRFIRYPIS